MFAATPLFWALLALLVGGAFIQLYRQRRGPAPVDPRALAFEELPNWPLAADAAELIALDLMTGGERSQAVITVELGAATAAERREVMPILGHQFYQRLPVDAVLVEAHSDQTQTPELFVFAADGRGWWGHEAFRQGFG